MAVKMGEWVSVCKEGKHNFYIKNLMEMNSIPSLFERDILDFREDRLIGILWISSLNQYYSMFTVELFGQERDKRGVYLSNPRPRGWGGGVKSRGG